MISGGGTLPSSEKVLSLCFGHSLFGAISLANPFGSMSIQLKLDVL